MGKVEVQVVSNQMIKPASQTPDNLRRYKLSFLDQISPRAYNPLIYFYSLNFPSNYESTHLTQISEKLKNSLSQVLTLYYPLAGRLVDDRFLDCNDDGVFYVEARVKAEISSVLENPIPLELNKLLPFELDEVAELPLGVQLNVFDCGGVAIGICVSHRLADALSSLVFIQNWMAIARGQNDAVIRPKFVSGDLFPPLDMGGFLPLIPVTKDMCNTYETKRFVFQSSMIESLRTKYQERTSQEARKTYSTEAKCRLSRIEVLSSFIWTRFAAATKLVESGLPAKEYTILQAVNIRPKFDPPLPNHSFGNYYVTSLTAGDIASTGEEEYSYGLARKIGEEIRKVDKGLMEYIRTNGDEYWDSIKKGSSRLAKGELVGFFFSSLCRLPLYEADFGLGKPTWVSSSSRGFNKSVALLDSKKGDAIEAYICLKPEDMAKLEADEEFLSCASPKYLPSVHDHGM